MVGFAAGGSSDAAARLLAQQMGVLLDRPFIVENRTGAAGRLAVEATKTAKPDGNTLMFVPHGAITLFPHIYKSLRYDPNRDFTPIGRVCTFDFSLSTGPATPAKTIAEYVTWARDKAHNASFGTPGAGTVPQFIGEGFAQRAGLTLTHVPYRGAAPSIIDLIAGTISLVVSPLADAIEYHKAGKVRVLATAGEQRTDMLAGIPTLKESGIDLAVDGWYGLYGPAGMAPELTRSLNQALVTATDKIRDKLFANALRAAPTSPEQLAQLQRKESVLWAQLVKASGFKPED
ncbi:MAG: ABC transporter substrate-binding protein [Burkholderiaceae bacterium]|nr:MAG: ABC transporter substrate-binding protein [Burkholderiaceae bacterium]